MLVLFTIDFSPTLMVGFLRKSSQSSSAVKDVLALREN